MLEIKPIKQTESMCGPYSLKMVLDYYGTNFSVSKIIKATHATKRFGTTAENIVEAARRFGFHAHITELGRFRDIRKYIYKKKIPVIVNWFSDTDGHYSVVVDIDSQFIYLADPYVKEIRKFPIKMFRQIWFGFSGNYPRGHKDIFIRRMIIVRKRLACSQNYSESKNKKGIRKKIKEIKKKLRKNLARKE